jgi:meso-butanediol dehydrogenase / (S,S)-butanediol dehydrogenase / diacetyl reductase
MSRVALVTGGGSGIGMVIAARLAADGWAVCVAGRRQEPLRASGHAWAAGDVGVPADAERIVAEAVAALGGLDLLVCNAGISRPGTVLEQTPEGWDELMRTNLTGVFLTCRAALPHLLERRGSIVTIGSAAGRRASTESAAYCTSKAGLAMLTQCLAIDHGPQGVRANCVAPGWVRTDMADHEMDLRARAAGTTREQAYADAMRNVPLRRASSAEEVAGLVAWLAGPEAASVTGTVIAVDGGADIVDTASLAVSG